MENLEALKLILRESDIPFFTDEQLNYYLEQDNNCVNDTAYHCLLIKAEDSTLQLSGYTSSDTSKYFLRLANRYRPTHSGILT